MDFERAEGFYGTEDAAFARYEGAFEGGQTHGCSVCGRQRLPPSPCDRDGEIGVRGLDEGGDDGGDGFCIKERGIAGGDEGDAMGGAAETRDDAAKWAFAGPAVVEAFEGGGEWRQQLGRRGDHEHGQCGDFGEGAGDPIEQRAAFEHGGGLVAAEAAAAPAREDDAGDARLFAHAVKLRRLRRGAASAKVNSPMPLFRRKPRITDAIYGKLMTSFGRVVDLDPFVARPATALAERVCTEQSALCEAVDGSLYAGATIYHLRLLAGAWIMSAEGGVPRETAEVFEEAVAWRFGPLAKGGGQLSHRLSELARGEAERVDARGERLK